MKYKDLIGYSFRIKDSLDGIDFYFGVQDNKPIIYWFTGKEKQKISSHRYSEEQIIRHIIDNNNWIIEKRFYRIKKLERIVEKNIKWKTNY